jgi:hypothetical protein
LPAWALPAVVQPADLFARAREALAKAGDLRQLNLYADAARSRNFSDEQARELVQIYRQRKEALAALK